MLPLPSIDSVKHISLHNGSWIVSDLNDLDTMVFTHQPYEGFPALPTLTMKRWVVYNFSDGLRQSRYKEEPIYRFLDWGIQYEMEFDPDGGGELEPYFALKVTIEQSEESSFYYLSESSAKKLRRFMATTFNWILKEA